MSPDELIDALGGSAEVARYLGVGTNTVGNWRKRGFPGWTLHGLRRMCEDRRIDPGASLPMEPPRRAKVAA